MSFLLLCQKIYVLFAFDFSLFSAFKLSTVHGNPGESYDSKSSFPFSQRMDIANFPLREDKIKEN